MQRLLYPFCPCTNLESIEVWNRELDGRYYELPYDLFRAEVSNSKRPPSEAGAPNLPICIVQFSAYVHELQAEKLAPGKL